MKIRRSQYWYIRLLTGRGVRPLFAGFMVGGGLLMILVIWCALIELLGGGIHLSVPRVVIELLFITLVSYVIAATVYTLEKTPGDVLALAPALDLGHEDLIREAAEITEQSRAIHIWTISWVLIAVALTWWTSGMAIEDNAIAIELSQSTINGWPYFRSLFYAFMLSQLTWIEVALARRLGKLLKDHGKVNLLDRSGFQALAKRSRRIILVWIPMLGHSFLFIAVVLSAVILPAVGIRQRYVREKDRQLEKVRARIAQRSAAVIDGSDTTESASLPELVAWEQRLQQARVWPYDMTMYSRVFLYGGIGLSSWIGAALVEQFLDAFIG